MSYGIFVNYSHGYDLSDPILFTRAFKYNEMSNSLMNLFKHNSTCLFDRLSIKYLNTVHRVFMAAMAYILNYVHTAA